MVINLRGFCCPLFVLERFFMDYFGYIVAFICGYLYKKYSFRFYAFLRAIWLLLKGFMIGRR